MSRHAHEHPCQACGKPFSCSGTYERNYDGWPEVICVLFHKDGFDWCQACRDKVDCPTCEGAGCDVCHGEGKVAPDSLSADGVR